MMIFRWLLFSLSALLMPNFLWAAPVNITDDLGQKIRLSNPARRIIVLTPHLAEILILMLALLVLLLDLLMDMMLFQKI